MSQIEFEAQFGTEAQCLELLYALRWANGYRCPRCGHNGAWQVEVFKYKCQRCKYQSSVTAGTLFQDTPRKLLPLWFRAIWYITSQPGRVNALEMQKELGLKTYRTAWMMLKKLRQVMPQSNTEKLQGIVKFDNFIKSGKFIALVVEINGMKIGRIRMAEYSNANNAYAFIQNSVEASSTIVSRCDGLKEGLVDRGYLWGERRGAISTLRIVEAWESSSLSMDEYCAKFNRYKAGITFYELLQDAVNLPLRLTQE